MLDLKFLRENPEEVKENIKKKFQDEKLPLVDTVYELDKEYRSIRVEADTNRKERNDINC
jgi:seryl-tRNA synthetase